MKNNIKDIYNKTKIAKLNNSTNKVKKTKTLLITGATGNLGSSILKRELKKYKKIYAISRKIKRNCGKIIWIKSDLSKSKLGLSKKLYDNIVNEVDTIIHCSANVNNFKNFNELYNDNVLSTINLIKFCNQGIFKKFHYASTLSVKISKYEKTKKYIDNKKLKLNNDHFLTGYAETKWISDYLVSQYVKNYSIYRYGLLIPKSKKLEKNHFLNVITKFAKKYKEFPIDYKDMKFDYSVMNNNILKIENKKGIYNKSNNYFLTLEQWLKINNIKIKWIDNNIWKNKYKKKIINRFFIKSKYYFFETTDIIKFL